MPNWNEPGNDTPTRRDIEEMERDNDDRRRRSNADEARTSRYLRDHPDASYAEADFYTQHKR